jgi:hypothetical protein
MVDETLVPFFKVDFECVFCEDFKFLRSILLHLLLFRLGEIVCLRLYHNFIFVGW